jgi:hypothetical protein
MPSYSYTSGVPIGISALNPTTGQFIEVVFSANGTTYSYSCVAWLPEIPIEDQVLVFTRPSSIGPETSLINGTDFQFGPNESIALNTTPSGEVVIRRSTDLSKMVFSYTDGAKLSAKQLNATMHQLLFIAQEKANFATNIQNFYPVSIVASAWNSGTSYNVNDVVIYNGTIYIAQSGPQSNNIPSSSPSVWKAQNQLSNGFYITGYNQPVNFDLTSMQENQTLVWSEALKKFVSGFAINSSDNLSDFELNNPTNNQVLGYLNSKWRNRTVEWTPSLFGSDLVFSKHIFTSVMSSFADNEIVLPGYLADFNRAQNEQIMPNASTVYHLLKKSIPNEEDPKTYFLNVNTQLNAAVQNLKNPVKAKLEWDLAYGAKTQRTETNSESLHGPYSAFWDHPNELYSPVGNSDVWFHSVKEGAIRYRISPWWSYTSPDGSPTTVENLEPKIHGYGIENFYLSIPDSCTSGFYIPTVKPDGNFSLVSDLSSIDELTSNVAIGGVYKDLYLSALRDLAFASARPETTAIPSTGDDLKVRDSKTRMCKGLLIQANYNSFSNISFKRLEQASEDASQCVFKIPEQIIYYSTAALALANKSLSYNYITTTDVAGLRNTVRFQGFGGLAPNTTLTESKVKTERHLSSKPMGYYYKANSFWSEWCQRWSTDTSNNYFQKFNEADVDWAVWDISNTSISHFDTLGSVLFDWNTVSLGQSDGPLNNRFPASRFYPWSFRPNQVNILDSGTRQVGTHLLNIDANTIFSSSSSFVPDPVDTYVFRVVLPPNITAAYFTETVPGSKPKINSAVLLEYGFRENSESGSVVPIGNDKKKLYPAMNADIGASNIISSKIKSRLDKSKVVCRVLSEQLESDISNVNILRYVIRIAISIPRLKSIGYSKVFRKFATGSTNTNYPTRDSGTSNDIEIDSGPWNFNLDMPLGSYQNSNLATDSTLSGLNWDIDKSSSLISTYCYLRYATEGEYNYDNIQNLVAGRNECAVKFTRLGIPSDFWLRLSILNTDASVSFVDPDTLDFTGE